MSDIIDTATPDRARMISDVTAGVQREHIATLRAEIETVRISELGQEILRLRAELAATVARNIELEKKRVQLEAEVDRLDALLRGTRTVSEAWLRPVPVSDSPDFPTTQNNDTSCP